MEGTYMKLYPKLETYSNFKNTVNLESYLKEIKNSKTRIAYSKFRLPDFSCYIPTKYSE